MSLRVYPQRFTTPHLRYEHCLKYFIGIQHGKSIKKKKNFNFMNVMKDFCGLIEDCILIENRQQVANYEFDEIVFEDIDESIINQSK